MSTAVDKRPKFFEAEEALGTVENPLFFFSKNIPTRKSAWVFGVGGRLQPRDQHSHVQSSISVSLFSSEASPAKPSTRFGCSDLDMSLTISFGPPAPELPRPE